MFWRMQNTGTVSARRARRSRAEWTADVVRWRKSGLGSAEYAAEHGLERSSLLWWSSQLGPNIDEREAHPSSAAPVAFVPLRVREDKVAVEAPAPGYIEVVLNNGRRVRVTGAVDGAELARVVAAVEGSR